MGWSRVLLVGATAGLAWSGVRPAQAQAWVPPAGEVSVTVVVGNRFANQHTDDRGGNLPSKNGSGWGSMTWNDADTNLGYGITDRLAAAVSVPFVLSRYQGLLPHLPIVGYRDEDDGSWFGAFGDFATELRFKATQGSLVVTPLLGFSTPSNSYDYYAHATAGLGLTEGQIGVNVGRLLDPWLKNAYAQVRYTFTVPQKVLDMSHDRSNVHFDAGYFVTSAMSVSLIGELQKSYGGWLIPDVPPPTDPRFLYHDQLLRSDHVRLGGTTSYALTGAIDLALSGYGTVYSRRDMNVRAFTLTMTYNFSPSQILKKRKTAVARPGSPS